MSASNHIEPSLLEIKQCEVCGSSKISKVLNNITKENLNDEKILSEENKDLDDEINNIFK